MKADKNTINLHKAQLRALLDFTSKDATDRERFGVQFEAKGSKLFARATNLARSVTCEGEADMKGMQGSWFITRDFLKACMKIAGPSSVIKLQPATGSGFVEARIGPEEDSEEPKQKFTSMEGCIQQLDLPNIARETRIPKGEELLTVTALPAAAMASIAVVGKAVGGNVAVESYASDDESKPSVFRIGQGRVQWTIAILPWATEATATPPKKSSKQGELPLEASTVPPTEAQTPRAKSNKPVDPAALAAEGRKRSKKRLEAEKAKGTKAGKGSTK